MSEIMKKQILLAFLFLSVMSIDLFPMLSWFTGSVKAGEKIPAQQEALTAEAVEQQPAPVQPVLPVLRFSIRTCAQHHIMDIWGNPENIRNCIVASSTDPAIVFQTMINAFLVIDSLARTILHELAVNKKIPALKCIFNYLIQNKARDGSQDEIITRILFLRDSFGNTVLHYIVLCLQEKDIEIIDSLLELVVIHRVGEFLWVRNNARELATSFTGIDPSVKSRLIEAFTAHPVPLDDFDNIGPDVVAEVSLADAFGKKQGRAQSSGSSQQ